MADDSTPVLMYTATYDGVSDALTDHGPGKFDVRAQMMLSGSM